MENYQAERSILEDFQKQLKENGYVTKGMVKSIERALGSNFISSNIRLESFTDTPTTINIDKTITAVADKLEEVKYLEEQTAYTLDDYHNDIYKIKEMIGMFLNKIVRIKRDVRQEVIDFLLAVNNRKFYNEENVLVDAFEMPLLKILTDNNLYSNALIELLANKENQSPDQAEINKNYLKTTVDSMIRDMEVQDYEINDPVFVVCSQIQNEHNGMKSILDLPTCPRAYERITLQTVLDMLIFNEIKDVVESIVRIEKELNSLAITEPDEATTLKVKELGQIVEKYKRPRNDLVDILKTFFTKSS